MSEGATRGKSQIEESQALAHRGRGRPPNLLQIAPPREMPERIRIINEYHESAIASLAQGAMYALLCGFELHAARAGLRHGQWEPWVEANCPFSCPTAWRYMQAAERKYKDIPNLANVKDFAFGVAPHALSAEQRMRLFDAVRFATDGESTRQLYLDLGLIKAPPARPQIGGDTSMYRQAKPTGDALAELERQEASAQLLRIVQDVRQFVAKRRWPLIHPAEMQAALVQIRKAIKKLEATA